MTVQVNIRVQVIIIHHWVFWALKIICIYSYKVFVKEHMIYYIICSFTKTLIPQLHVYIPVHSFTKAWTCIPQFHTLYLLQLQLHKCLWLVSFNFSICIIFYIYANVCFLLLEVYCIIGILQVVCDILFQDYTIVWDNYNDMDCSFRSDSLQFWSILFPLRSLFLPPLSCWMHSCS